MTFKSQLQGREIVFPIEDLIEVLVIARVQNLMDVTHQKVFIHGHLDLLDDYIAFLIVRMSQVQNIFYEHSSWTEDNYLADLSFVDVGRNDDVRPVADHVEGADL